MTRRAAWERLADLTWFLVVGWGLGTMLVGWHTSVAAEPHGGWVETKDKQTFVGHVQVVEGPSLRIRLDNGSVKEVPLSEVRTARLGRRITTARDLPSGWQVEDAGLTHSQSTGHEGQFNLRAYGEPPAESKQAPLHLIYRVLRGDGEIIARIQEVEGPPGSLAGVMMHENLELMGGMVLLGVSPDKHLRVRSRENGWSALSERDLGSVTLPLWLKVSRQEKDRLVRLARSEDGRAWQNLGQLKLGCRVEPWPEGSDSWRARVPLGLGLATTNADVLATARFDNTAIVAQGLLGEYFADSSLHSLVFSRPDDRMEFWWGDGSPGPGVPEDHFGVRWTGRLQPSIGARYRFHLEADNEARLWLDGQEVLTSGFKSEGKGVEIPLEAGQYYNLKIEYKEGAGAASFRLGWSRRNQAIEVIPASQLTCVLRDPLFPLEPGAQGSEGDGRPSRYVRLVHGSVIAGKVVSMDEGLAQIAFPRMQDLSIPSARIAEIHFRPARAVSGPSVSRELPGVVLRSGSFLREK